MKLSYKLCKFNFGLSNLTFAMSSLVADNPYIFAFTEGKYESKIPNRTGTITLKMTSTRVPSHSSPLTVWAACTVVLEPPNPARRDWRFHQYRPAHCLWNRFAQRVGQEVCFWPSLSNI